MEVTSLTFSLVITNGLYLIALNLYNIRGTLVSRMRCSDPPDWRVCESFMLISRFISVSGTIYVGLMSAWCPNIKLTHKIEGQVVKGK